MKEQDLIDLEFKKSYITDLYPEHKDSELKPYYYYTYNITNELCLISSILESASSRFLFSTLTENESYTTLSGSEYITASSNSFKPCNTVA